jgi:hypothetical protein
MAGAGSRRRRGEEATEEWRQKRNGKEGKKHTKTGAQGTHVRTVQELEESY